MTIEAIQGRRPSKIQETIKEFLDLILGEDTELKELDTLISALDKLAYSIRFINYIFDETHYPDAPAESYSEIRECVQKKFPTLGFYNISIDISENIGETEPAVGDAFDDIADITRDLKEVMWYFENTSPDNALWNYELGYRAHWGRHLRELQLYLHDKKWQP